MRKLFCHVAIFYVTMVVFAHAQQACQWNYQASGNQSNATICGNVLAGASPGAITQQLMTVAGSTATTPIVSVSASDGAKTFNGEFVQASFMSPICCYFIKSGGGTSSITLSANATSTVAAGAITFGLPQYPVNGGTIGAANLLAGTAANPLGSWLGAWDTPSPFPAINQAEIISSNGARALTLASRSSDTNSTVSPETLVRSTLADKVPPLFAQGVFGGYNEIDIDLNANVGALGDENEFWTTVPSYYASIASNPYTLNGYPSQGTASYAGSTLTVSGFGWLRTPQVGDLVNINGITGQTGGPSINGNVFPIASLSGGPSYTATFSIPGIVGTIGGTATMFFQGHSAMERAACGAGRTVPASPTKCSVAHEVLPNGNTFETAYAVAVGSIDLSSATAASATHSANLVTLTFTSTPDWALSGEPVVVAGDVGGGSEINGQFTIVGTDATHIFYTLTGSNTPSGTITVNRTSAPAYAMAEQQAIRWYGPVDYTNPTTSGGEVYSEEYEKNDGSGNPVQHISIPRPNGTLSFEFNGTSYFDMNGGLFYTPNNSSLGASTLPFGSVWTDQLINYAGYSGSGGSAVPTCNSTNAGMFVKVTDGKASPTSGGTYAPADGAATQPIWCNGTAWLYLM